MDDKCGSEKNAGVSNSCSWLFEELCSHSPTDVTVMFIIAVRISDVLFELMLLTAGVVTVVTRVRFLIRMTHSVLSKVPL